jgi:hypothetical protein
MNLNADYRNGFKGEFDNSNDIRYQAFQVALATRSFEIELYWKRATYFWAFIAASFAAYFAIFDSKDLADKSWLALVIASLGFFFTFAFFLVNKGSKMWQENWENHVAVLGQEIVGPLFSTVLSRPDENPSMLALITNPGKFSVSKINQWVSFHLVLIWIFLAAQAIYSDPLKTWCSWTGWPRIISVVLGTALSAALMWRRARTDFGTHRPIRNYIETEIGR